MKDTHIGTEFVVIKCPYCNGEGRVFNPFFEQCRHTDWLKEVGLEKPGDCKHCENRDCKDEGEFLQCGACQGDKLLLKAKNKKEYLRGEDV